MDCKFCDFPHIKPSVYDAPETISEHLKHKLAPVIPDGLDVADIATISDALTLWEERLNEVYEDSYAMIERARITKIKRTLGW